MIDQLARLNELAPDICRVNLAPTPVQYFIGDYGFWVNPAGELIACPMGLLDKNIGGRFALAWLRDAIEGEIERRGWGCRVEMWDLSGKYAALVWHLNYTNDLTFGDSALECLLAAFLAAVEGEGSDE